MRIKFVVLGCCLAFIGATALGQTILRRNASVRKSSYSVGSAALCAMIFVPAITQAQLPPAQTPPPPAQAPPERIGRPNAIQPPYKPPLLRQIPENQLGPALLPSNLEDEFFHDKTHYSQRGKPEADDSKDKSTPLSQKSDAGNTSCCMVAPANLCPANPDSAKVDRSRADYMVWQNDFKRRTYEDQLVQTRIIFFLVLVLVCAGLFFSWLQFRHSFHLKRVLRSGTEAQGDSNNAATPLQDEFAFGKDGVVIRSAYLGVIILVISMAFFFLYLKYVYLIS